MYYSSTQHLFSLVWFDPSGVVNIRIWVCTAVQQLSYYLNNEKGAHRRWLMEGYQVLLARGRVQNYQMAKLALSSIPLGAEINKVERKSIYFPMVRIKRTRLASSSTSISYVVVLSSLKVNVVVLYHCKCKRLFHPSQPAFSFPFA